MADDERDLIEIPPGFRSREAASFLSQLDDLSRRMGEDTRGLTPAELEWQPAPGMNTIGMLLAHLAIVEVFWTCRGLEGAAEVPDVKLLGIGGDDDGMPLPDGGMPPRALAGLDLASFDAMLASARERLRATAMALDDADLDREQTRSHAGGKTQRLNARWLLYHMLEHLAGHYGQILLLRHQYRATRRA